VGTVWVRYEGRIEGERGERRSRLRVGNEEGGEGREVIHVEYLGWRDHGELRPSQSSLALRQKD